jgi:predicted Zn-dependent protease
MASSIPIPTTTPGCNSWCWKPRYQQAENRIAREDFLRRIDRMVFADSPRQGVIRNSDFYHAELGIALQFPPGWRIQNRTQKVEARSPQDDVLIELAAAGPAQGSPSEVLRRFARLDSGEVVTPSTINGLPAAIAVTRIRGLPTRVVLVFWVKQPTPSERRHNPPSR